MSGRRLRALGGAVVLGVVVLLAGPDAVPSALTSVDAGALLAGTVIGAVTTMCAAWRWQVVARHLGTRLSMPAAVIQCYRAQLLNATLPGGVLGDVGRGVGHGRAVGDIGLGLRAVAWERTCGFAVLVVLTVGALLVAGASWVSWPALPSWLPAVAAAATGALALAGSRWLRGPVRRVIRTAVADSRALATPGA
ncbi:MAG: lysylphosphatidylglycerol synthase domain-containing protein, partial [Dermatophilaceae bacterium]